MAELDSFVESSGGSNTGGGDSVATNGAIATNLVLGTATAEIRNSTITTSGGVSVIADNEASIEATNKSVTLSGDEAVGASIAFNTVGYAPTNILAASFDALLGTSLQQPSPAQATARVINSTLAAAGNVEVKAFNEASIEANLLNDATSSAGALWGASGAAASGLLANNRVAGGALAEIDDSDVTTSASGNLTLLADDNAFINATSVMKAISSTTNDGGASLIGGMVEQLGASYAFTSESGTQPLKEDDRVRVASGHQEGGVPGATYRYVGAGSDVDLSDTDYSDASLWARVSESSPADLIPQGLNVSESDSVAMG
ncbi:hypothetical protein GH984_10740, partial [Spiribacter sp. C176]|nr:hypothetical protein [Spiribacter salilacus]